MLYEVFFAGMSDSEADTCRKLVVPRLQQAGWDSDPHSIAEQRTITDGRIVPVGKGFVRRSPKRADYLLRYRRDFLLAVVEAKAAYKTSSAGLQQAKDYAQMLGLNFANATNEKEIVEFDYFTGLERTLAEYPSPAELWKAYCSGAGIVDVQIGERLLTPCNYAVGKAGHVVKVTVEDEETHTEPADAGDETSVVNEPPPTERRKFYFDRGRVEVSAHLVYELDPDGKQLCVIRYTDYAAEKTRTLCPTAPELRAEWSDPLKRAEIIRRLEERGDRFEELAEAADQPEADPFDLLCHLAFNAPLRTRRERAQQLRDSRKDSFARYSPEARQILDELLEKYADHGSAQFVLPDERGQVGDIIRVFGGAEELRTAVAQFQTILYAA